MPRAKLGRLDHFAISHCLRSEALGCGCVLGVYATFGNRILEVIDERGRACREPAHAPGAIVDSDHWQPLTA